MEILKCSNVFMVNFVILFEPKLIIEDFPVAGNTQTSFPLKVSFFHHIMTCFSIF